jgi:hypothetical protein
MDKQVGLSVLYEGKTRDGYYELFADGVPLSVADAQCVCHRSSAFRWGGLGPGSDQAAVAILFHHLKRFVRMGDQASVRTTLKMHKAFGRHVIACMPEMWMMDSRAVEEFRMMAIRQDMGHDVSWPLWRASVFEYEKIVATKGAPRIRGSA